MAIEIRGSVAQIGDPVAGFVNRIGNAVLHAAGKTIGLVKEIDCGFEN
jgi:hypothetical protein